MRDLIESWSTSVLLRHDPSRLTTRAWNGYDGPSENRAFRYKTAKKRLTPEDLPVPTPIPSPSQSAPSTPGPQRLMGLSAPQPATPNPPPLLAARSFHLICSPSRCRDVVTNLISARREAGISPSRPPFIVWEPVPDSCSPDELLACTNALPLVDVCSPNHAELAAFMGDADRGVDPVTGKVCKQSVERACEQLLASMPLQSYALVVRAGDAGVFICRNGGRKRKDPTRGAGGGKDANASSQPQSGPQQPPSTKKRVKKEYIRGGLRPDTDMMALFAGLAQEEDGAIAREEIEVDPGVERWFPAYHAPPPTRTDGEEGADSAGQQQGSASGSNGSGAAAHNYIVTITDNDNINTNNSDLGTKFNVNGSRPIGSHGNPKVVDPTGAGNAFLGALSVALARGRSLEEAALWGSVAASFVIEQVGVPKLGWDDRDGGSETWNGERVADRLRHLAERTGMADVVDAGNWASVY